MARQTKNRLRRWVLMAIAILFAVCLLGWFWVNSTIKAELSKQFASAGIDTAQIGSVQTGLGGFTARDIRFESDGVEFELDSLEVQQPILDLIQDKGPKDEIALRGVKVSVNAEELGGGSGFSLSDVDPKLFDSVARRVSLQDLELKFFDNGGETEIALEKASVNSNDESLFLSGNGSLLDGDLQFSGSVAKESGNVELTFVGNKLHLVDQKWQNWPGIGPAIQKHLGADSIFHVNGSVTGDLKSGLAYRAEVVTKDAWLYIPKFDLRIKVRSADILVENGTVTYRDVFASMGDKDVVHGSGTTSFAGFPILSEFEGEFSDANVADLRKLVKEIPDKVVGTATGKVTGSVSVDKGLNTTLRLFASGDTNEAYYGEINASSGFVDVQIKPLVISPKGKTLDLQGSVVVKATTKQQDVDGILETFDLTELDRQFEFEMLGDGDVDLRIPLDSAPDLRTWTLGISAGSPSGSVGGIKLQDLNVRSFLQDGQLVFDSATANLAGRAKSSVEVKVTWPLPNRAAKSIAKTGTVNVSGSGVPPAIGLMFFDRQMANAGIDYSAKPQVNSIANSGIDGGLNFNASIVLPAGKTRPIDSWIVKASLSDSKLTLANETMNRINSAVSIQDGVLKVDSLTGHIDNGGNVDAKVSVALTTGEIKDVQLKALQFPASWLANTIIESDTTGKFVDRTGMSPENVSEKLSGVFDANIGVELSNPENVLWDASSDELVVFGSKFENIRAAGHYDGQLDIEKIVAELPGGGMARLEGDWIAGSDEGNFQLQWKGAAVAPFLRSQIQLPESFDSDSEGQLEITFVDGKPQYAGEFDLIEPKVFGGTFADHRFEISTRGGRIYFRDIPDKKRQTVSLNGSLSLERPFEFEIDGQTDSMSLSTAILDKLSGTATAKFRMSGQASPWQVKTAGTAKFENLAFDKSQLSEVRSTWDFDTQEPNQQSLEFAGLGGIVSFDPTRSQGDSLVFLVEDVQLSELSAFRKLPVALSGAVSGTAKIDDWNDPDKQQLTLEGESDLVRVGNARLSRTLASASVSNGGKDLAYGFESQFLDGKLIAEGQTRLSSLTDPWNNSFPLKVRLSNGRMNRVAETISSTPIPLFRQLQGRISATMDWEVTPGEYPKGLGSVALEDIKYRNRVVSRKIESGVSLSNGIVQLKGIRADLQQGEISGRATVPLVGSASGSYALDIRNFSLARMLYVLVDDPIEAGGVVNARISGRVGRSVSGTGTLGVSQAGFFGVSSESMKIPIRYRIDPGQRKVRIEMPSTRIKAFRGTIDGSAKIEIGTRTQLESKLELSNIDSQALIRTMTGYRKSGTGKLSGKLEVKSRNFRTENDLAGSFRGKLKQSNALSFPVLEQVTRFLGNTTTLRNDQFDSDSIELTMAKGRVDIRNFRLQNTLASIIVSGQAWLNGKLDLEVAARVERLNQPTLIDQLAGSPISRIVGPETAFFAQAAEFLSERIVFVDVTGTATRPQFRLNPGKQLKEEAIRYFLRGSQILPNTNGQNN